MFITIVLAAQHQVVPALYNDSVQSKSFAVRSQAERVRPARPAPKENFDIRIGHQHSLREAQGQVPLVGSKYRTQKSSTSSIQFRLKRERPGVRFEWSSLTNRPDRVWSLTDDLTMADRDDAEVITRRFIGQHQDLFGLAAEEIQALTVSRRYQSIQNGVTHLTLQQQVGGIEVFQAELAVHLRQTGEILAVNGELIPDADQFINQHLPTISSADALRIAARDVELEVNRLAIPRLSQNSADARQTFSQIAGFEREVAARLVYFPISAGQLRLGWQFIMWMKETPDVYLTVIDAERGSLLYRYNLTCYEENPLHPAGLVFNAESPRPNLPYASPSPALTEQTELPFRSFPWNGTALFSADDRHYDWWAGATADKLITNNADVALDSNGDNLPDSPRLQQSDGRFLFRTDFTSANSVINNQTAAQVNLLFWINRYHDILYSLGFTESAGNFQTNNFSLGGIAGDAIQGDVQDGSGRNNANFTTPPDGGAGRVQMYLWGDNPQSDSAFDQTVIIHELTHGLSNRLIGNATGLAAMQSAGMGEGWSDFFALALLAREDASLSGSYPMAQYVSGNYQRGIRRYPYSTSLAINPLTYGMIKENREIHAVGEIWCSVLWDLRAAMIQQYGFQQGQQQSLRLVVDGMKLAPRTPSFIDARNAILLADRVNNSGANQCLLWQTFAKRGLGYSAFTSDANDAAPVEAFDNVPWCGDTAILQLDRTGYLNGESVQIILNDRNAAVPVKVQVSSSITGDRETVALLPDDEAPGRFRGAIRLIGGVAINGDGQLQASVTAGDQLNVTYHDATVSGSELADISVRADVTREKVIFADSVEHENQGWIASGRWGITTARATSPGHSWTDSPNGDYFNNDNTWLISPVFDLTGMQDVSLSFAHSYQLDSGMDYAIVEYSRDEGMTWSRATAFTGTQPDFVPARLTLPALAGQARARIRLRLVTDAQVNGDGWYVDDIQLTGRSADSAIVPDGSTNVPTLASLSPAFGSPAGATLVTINGTGFTDDAVVSFDGNPAISVQVLSHSTIRALTPAHVAGSVIVRVRSRNGESALAEGFTYYNTGAASGFPTLSSLIPGTGALRGGTVVTIYGAGFTPETQVNFGTRKAGVEYLNRYTLRAVAPGSSAPGKVDVSVVNIAADIAAQSRLTSAYEYLVSTPPQVEVISPTNGETVYAGSTLVIGWNSSDNHVIKSHRVRLYRQSGTDVILAGDIGGEIGGDAQSLSWKVPADQPLQAQVRVGITAVDDEGSETEAYSGGWFTIARRWETSAPLPQTLQGFATVSDGQYLYSIGGRSNGDPTTSLNLVQRLEPQASRLIWKSTGLARIPTAESGADAVCLYKRIYLPGGINAAGQMLRKHQVYDIDSNIWDQAAELPQAVINYALAADEQQGRYYLTGGSLAGSVNTTIAAVWMYEVATDKWTELPPMKVARTGHRAELIAGKLYVVGGTGASGVLTSGEVYDFTTGQWQMIASLNHPRQFATSTFSYDKVGNPFLYLIGGVDSADLVTASEVYDVRNNRWLVLDDSFNLPSARAWLGGAKLNEYFYAIGGFTLLPTSIGGRLLISQPNNDRLNLSAVTLNTVNQAPVLTVPGEQLAVAGHEISFTVMASDLGSQVPVTVSVADLPAGADFQTTSSGNNKTQGIFRWTPDEADNGRLVKLLFTASDGQVSEAKLVRIRVVAGTKISAVNAADYNDRTVAADSIAVIFGQNLAAGTRFAETQPLPLELAGTTVSVNGVAARLLFVSPTQINFVVPAELEPGRAGIVVSNPDGNYAAGTMLISRTAPALFTSDASGKGDAAAAATPDGLSWQSAPFDVHVNGKPNHLVLYGTGLRKAQTGPATLTQGVAEAVSVLIDGHPARVSYAGAQGQFSGLDQINVEFPPELSSGGPRRVTLVMTVEGAAANAVTIQIR